MSAPAVDGVLDGGQLRDVGDRFEDVRAPLAQQDGGRRQPGGVHVQRGDGRIPPPRRRRPPPGSPPPDDGTLGAADAGATGPRDGRSGQNGVGRAGWRYCRAGWRYCRIRIAGRFDPPFLHVLDESTFSGVEVESEVASTVLSGVCADAAAVFGVLDQIRDLGLDLLDVSSFAIAPDSGRTGVSRR
ncbi:MAG TPA: hypothetical protein VI248_26290 [Kineosporiaceae bacterium]